MLTSQQTSAIEHLKTWKVGALFMEPGTGKTRVAINLVNSTDCTDVIWVGPLRTLRSISDEVLRLKQITGLAEAFKNEEFSRSWSPEVLTNKQE